MKLGGAERRSWSRDPGPGTVTDPAHDQPAGHRVFVLVKAVNFVSPHRWPANRPRIDAQRVWPMLSRKLSQAIPVPSSAAAATATSSPVRALLAVW